MKTGNSIIDWLEKAGNRIKQAVVLDGNRSSTSQELSNKILVDKVAKEFINGIKKHSGEKILSFPMCFYIDMANTDFEKKKQDFPLIVLEIKDKLLEIIEIQKADYKRCEPPASFWYFEFRASEHIEDKIDDDIPEGKPDIHAQLRGKRKLSNTNTTDTDLNRTLNRKDDVSEKLRFESGMRDDERTFTPIYSKISDPVITATNESKSRKDDGVYATLEENGNKFSMKQQEVEICGKNDSRNLPQTIMRLNVNLPVNPYVIIKYRPDKPQKFSIEARGTLLLNDKNIELNTPFQLFSGSTIMIPNKEKPVIIGFKSSKTQ